MLSWQSNNAGTAFRFHERNQPYGQDYTKINTDVPLEVSYFTL